jgi:hypothetical protein
MTNNQDIYLTTFLLVTLTHNDNRDESHYRTLNEMWSGLSQDEQHEVRDHINKSNAPKDLTLLPSMKLPPYTKKLSALKLIDKDGNDVTPNLETNSIETLDGWDEMERRGAASARSFVKAFENENS